jgi:hypothetical protein
VISISLVNSRKSRTARLKAAVACELPLDWKKGQCGEIVVSAQARNERAAEVSQKRDVERQ